MTAPAGTTRRDVLAGATLLAASFPTRAEAAFRGSGRLPRWRGFNLQNKVAATDFGPFEERDFDIVAGWGFDFVRLPLHYRLFTPAPGRHDEAQLRLLDQAVAWGRARGIHVDLCLHTAPGYCVGGASAEAERRAGLDLWGSGAAGDRARAQFTAQWAMLAERYAGVPASALSFNLVNEPPEIAGETYLKVVAPAVEAIRARDPGRLIIADGTGGTDGGRNPVPALLPLRIAQSTRGYRPFSVTHWRAPWVFGADTWPAPRWPVPNAVSATLYGAEKPDLQTPLLLEVQLDRPATLDIHLALVSGRAQLVVEADGTRVLDHMMWAAPDRGEWKELYPRPEWNGYQALYDRSFAAQLPAGTRRAVLRVIDGDWLTFNLLRLVPGTGREIVLAPGLTGWGLRQPAGPIFLHDGDGPGRVEAGSRPAGPGCDRAALWRDEILPWQAIERSGTGVHVGEWGIAPWTPNAVALAFARDCLANWKQAGWGWALWNLRGQGGPLDGDREDARWENWRGQRLDRPLLEVLQQG